ncbi:MAG: hypothetical protein GY862_13565 [Gammaproteobacteria bacterium]|nr:hypothetical protein [Gammaproteobacteria bacterium]
MSQATDGALIVRLDSAAPADKALIVRLDSAAPADSSLMIPCGSAVPADGGLIIVLEDENVQVADVVSGIAILLDQPADVGNSATFFWLSETNPEKYFFVNASIRTAEGTNVDAQNATLETDMDSYLWSAAGTIIGNTAKALIDPVNGPVDIIIAANGYEIPVIVESVVPAGAATHGNAATWNFKGRSPSAVLSEPYTAPITRMWESFISARQIVDQLLLDAGWTVDWQIDDWDIPAGVYSVKDTGPMQIITQLVGIVGAYVSTSLVNKNLTVKYRHTKNPTMFLAGDESGIIHDSRTFAEALAWHAKPCYNRVIFCGTTAGFIVTCTLNGTAGNAVAPVQTHPLILTAQVGRNAGRNFLYEKGFNQLHHVRTFPMHFVDYPLMEPGMVMREENSGWFGIVDGVKLSISHKSISQTVTLKEYKP